MWWKVTKYYFLDAISNIRRLLGLSYCLHTDPRWVDPFPQIDLDDFNF